MPHVPGKPSRDDPHSNHHAALHERVFEGKGLIRAGAGVTVSVDADGTHVISSTARNGGSLSGFRWAAKREVDPTATYSVDEEIHIQATHSLVTTGIRDAAAPELGLVKSRPGRWRCLRNCPAKTTVDGNEVWNLPQWPMPEPENYDDPNNYWLLLSQDQFCV